MEPFRPQVDAAVIVLRQAGIEEVTPDAKLKLVEVMSREIELSDGFTPLSRATERLATSLAQSFVSKENKLELPKSKSFFMRERLVGRAKI